MTHTGAGDKCSKWDRGKTVDKTGKRGYKGTGEERKKEGGEAIDLYQIAKLLCPNFQHSNLSA